MILQNGYAKKGTGGIIIVAKYDDWACPGYRWSRLVLVHRAGPFYFCLCFLFELLQQIVEQRYKICTHLREDIICRCFIVYMSCQIAGFE